MRTILHAAEMILVVFLGLIVASCKSDSSNTYGSPTAPSTSPANTASNTVEMSGMSFIPAQITVKVGTTVTWTNNDSFAHTATSDSSGGWDTGNIAGGKSAAHTFNTAGTFPYRCTYHAAMGMVGTVIVQ